MNSDKLQDNINDSLNAENRLVLLVGPPGCGKSRILRGMKDVSVVNVGKELGRDLRVIPREDRPDKAMEILASLIEIHPKEVVVLDNIELLLQPDLKLDLWPALGALGANKKLIIAWTGRVYGQEIQWGDPGVPGHLVMSLENCPAKIVSMTG